jgi:opacity protein-like surface antigen
MKIIFIIGALIAGVLFPVNAALSQQHPSDGVYLGVEGSYDQTKDNIKATPSNVYTADGIAAGLLIGYRQSHDRVSLGVEARYGYSFVSNEINTITPTQGFDITHEFGASILPGFWIADEVLIYARFGFTQSTLVTTLQSVESKYNDTAIELGAGIQIFATDTISIRGEYVRTNFEGQPSLLYNGVIYDDWKVRRNRFRGALIAKF